jgi:hypothetical protein
MPPLLSIGFSFCGTADEQRETGRRGQAAPEEAATAEGESHPTLTPQADRVPLGPIAALKA